MTDLASAFIAALGALWTWTKLSQPVLVLVCRAWQRRNDDRIRHRPQPVGHDPEIDLYRRATVARVALVNIALLGADKDHLADLAPQVEPRLHTIVDDYASWAAERIHHP